MKRRDFLATIPLVGGATAFAAREEETARKKSFRVAHLTDIHVKPGEIPEKGMAKALQAAQALKPKADFIINSGDSIMDALEADKTSVTNQWKLFQKILKEENDLPVYHAIGNHDIWGWFNKNELDKQDKMYGKQWAVDELQIPERYYSFEKDNWVFIVLDSTQLNPNGGYIAYLDDTQLNWLKDRLSSIQDKHVCIVSHIPILSICSGLFFNKTETNGDLLLKRNLMHTDFLKLKEVFKTYSNIKVCISGHIHLQDEVTYLGVKYYCNGAVSGNWWKGSFQEFAPAFAVMDFFNDGTFKRSIVTY
jgi:3',5'-cyclic-AMP phosphodiesterase